MLDFLSLDFLFNSSSSGHCFHNWKISMLYIFTSLSAQALLIVPLYYSPEVTHFKNVSTFILSDYGSGFFLSRKKDFWDLFSVEKTKQNYW